MLGTYVRILAQSQGQSHRGSARAVVIKREISLTHLDRSKLTPIGFGSLCLRSKRSRVRVAPGPLWKAFPRWHFSAGGGFAFMPRPLRGVFPGDKPHVSEPIPQRLEVLFDQVLDHL